VVGVDVDGELAEMGAAGSVEQPQPRDTGHLVVTLGHPQKVMAVEADRRQVTVHVVERRCRLTGEVAGHRGGEYVTPCGDVAVRDFVQFLNPVKGGSSNGWLAFPWTVRATAVTRLSFEAAAQRRTCGFVRL